MYRAGGGPCSYLLTRVHKPVDCVVFHQKHAFLGFFLFHVSKHLNVRSGACMCSSLPQPATTSAWKRSRPTGELIWQTLLSPERPESLWKLNLMKAHMSKTFQLTSAQDFSYNQLHCLLRAKPLSFHLPGSLSSHLSCSPIWSLMCSEGRCGPRALEICQTRGVRFKN